MASFTFGYGGAYGYRGSLSLAQILYQTSPGNFTYNTDSSGNVVLTNQGNLGTSYDGLPYSGRGIELGATNDVDIPIHHTLGTDGSSHTMGINAVEIATSDNLDGSYSVIGTSTNSNSYIEIVDLSITTSEVVLVEFTAIINSGSAIIDRYFDGVSIITLDNPHTVVNGTNKIEVKNRPSRGAFLYFPTATTIDMDITPVSIKQVTNPSSYLTLYDFTLGLTYVDCSTLTPSTTYNIVSKTVNNVLTHTTAWNATDKSKIENNPNLVGKLAIETLGATKTIAELDMELDQGASADSYYMCSEKSGAYLVDSRAGYGSNIVTTLDTAPTYSDEIGTYTKISDSAFDIAVTTIGTSTLNPALVHGAITTDVSGLALVEFDAVVNSGTAIITQAYVGEQHIVNYTIVNGKNTIIVPTGGATLHRTYFDGTNLFNISITNYKIRQVQSFETIANYASTIRTNADLQQKGIQTTAFVTDGVGVPTAYSSNLLQFIGDGRYVDTGFMPPSDSAWEIDLVIECKADGVSKLNGILTLAGDNKLYIGQNTTNKITAQVGNSVQTTALAVSDGLHHVRIEYDGSGGGNVVYDNSETDAFSLSGYTYSATERFFLGAVSRAGAYLALSPNTLPTGLFQYVTKERTAAERDADHAKAKAIYPPLP